MIKLLEFILIGYFSILFIFLCHTAMDYFINKYGDKILTFLVMLVTIVAFTLPFIFIGVNL